MGLKTIAVEGLEAFEKAAEENKDKTVFALFSGHGWCPDCVLADPVVEAAVANADVDNAVFINCNVGDLKFWKDQNNVFRKHPKLALKCVPTLMCYGKSMRLEEGQCADKSLVEMLLSDE